MSEVLRMKEEEASVDVKENMEIGKHRSSTRSCLQLLEAELQTSGKVDGQYVGRFITWAAAAEGLKCFEWYETSHANFCYWKRRRRYFLLEETIAEVQKLSSVRHQGFGNAQGDPCPGHVYPYLAKIFFTSGDTENEGNEALTTSTGNAFPALKADLRSKSIRKMESY
ncbi:unnamed protein product [Larinioides sclopetarius]|uniref:Uncharacterized protein n=1 Tax=Larinioides sclopetarius TaxID=280406 RepID=A0AAV2AWI6_9ARAC